MRTFVSFALLLCVGAAVAYQFRDDLLAPRHTWNVIEGDKSLLTGAPEEALAEVDEQVQREAVDYIESLAATAAGPISIDRADHFIRHDQVISLLPDQSVDEMTPAEMFSDPSLDSNRPITVIRSTEQMETTTPSAMVAHSAGDLDKPVKIVIDEQVVNTTVREVLERFRAEPDEPITVVRDVEHYVVTTAAELERDPTLERNQPLRIIRRPYRLESATVDDLLFADGSERDDSVFYVRSVRDSDEQGIWGIVHYGIIDNFARGMAVRRGEGVDNYRIEIPKDADEVLADGTSSFLGKLIHKKTLESFVYNYENGGMGRNPHYLAPGQQIVIIKFSPQDLVNIYKHFVEEQGPNAQDIRASTTDAS